MEMMIDLALDAVLDTLKLIPFLYVVYLVIGYFERHSDNKLYEKLAHTRIGGPILGALIGCVPQCGFSVIGANLYSKKMIGLGTLLAIFISTSDEAVPILLAYPEKIGMVLWVLVVKVGIAILVGLSIEGIMYLFNQKQKDQEVLKNKKVSVTSKKGVKISKNKLKSIQGKTTNLSREALLEGNCGCGSNCNHEEKHTSLGVVALKHTLRISLFILVVNLILNGLFEGLGEGILESILLTDSIFQPVVAALIGMIPNCAASIVLTEMFVKGAISFGSLIAGLCTGAGMGLVILFKSNKNTMDNFKILGILYVIGTVSGMLLQFIW